MKAWEKRFDKRFALQALIKRDEAKQFTEEEIEKAKKQTVKRILIISRKGAL